MLVLIFGLLLWVGTHSIKRLAPKFRRGLGDNAGKGLVTAASLVSIALMVIGYRMEDGSPIYQLGDWSFRANNLLVVIGIALLMVQTANSRVRNIMRHPMLTGFILWALGHLLIGGEARTIVLFGGLGLWAIAAIFMINRSEKAYKPYTGGTAKGDVILVVITAVMTALIAAIHIWLGLSPFGVMG
jgi:uncharacterized membrane protein